MDEEKLLILEELEKRDELSSDKKEILEELRNRNIIRERKTSFLEDIGYAAEGINTELVDFIGSTGDLINNMPRLVGKTATNIADFSSKIVPMLASRGSAMSAPVLASNVEQKNPPVYSTPSFPEMLGAKKDAPGIAQTLRKGLKNIGMGFESLEEVPPSARPWAVGGGVIGRSIPFAVAPYLATRKLAAGAVMPESLVSPILKSVKEAPARFAGTEAAFTGYSAGGGGVAEAISPGNKTAQMYGEILAPLSPAVVSKIPTIARGGARFAKSYSRAGRESEAARLLQQEVSAGGEIPKQVAKKLAEPEIESLTSGQITGDAALLAIEKKLISGSGQLSGVMDTKVRKSITDFNKKFRKIIEEGDPESIKKASALRVKVLEEYLNKKVERAESLINKANESFTSPLNREQTNIEARKILTDAFIDGRKTETGLWDLVRNRATIPIKVDNFKSALQSVKANLLLGDSLGKILETYYKRLKKIDTMPVKDLVGAESLSSKLSAKARALRAQGISDEAVRYEILVKAIKKDVLLITEPGVLNSLKNANQFSLTLNTLFKRDKVVRNTLSRNRQGGDVVNEALTLDAAIRPKEIGNINLRALREAAGLSITPTSISKKRQTEMEGLQNNLLRIMAGETRNYDGTINVAKLTTFIKSNAEALKTAKLYSVFADARTAQTKGQEIINTALKQKKSWKEKTYSSRIARGDVNTIIKNAFKSNAIDRNFTLIANVVRNRGKKGMQYAIMEHLLDSSTIQGRISGKSLTKILDTATEKTIKDINGDFKRINVEESLINKKLLTQDQVDNLKVLANKAEIFENALRNTGTVDDLLGKEDAVLDLLTRIFGSQLGTKGLASNIEGSSLVKAQAGVRFVRNMVNKMPRAKVQSILVEAMFNPALMKKLLEKPTSIQEKILQAKQINAFLIQAGIPTNDAYYE